MSEAPLEIKPGKYRTRGGEVVRVMESADVYWLGYGYAWRAMSERGKELFFTTDGRFRSFGLYGTEAREDSRDLIERIEDEKAEDKCKPKFLQTHSYVGLDLASRFDRAINGPGNGTFPSGKVTQVTQTTSLTGEKKYSEADHQFCVELVVMLWRARVAELEAKIAQLEAENESLSRQLRSRKLNEEPVSTGKKFRWSPMV